MAVFYGHFGMAPWKNYIFWLLVLLVTTYHPIVVAENTGKFQFQNEAGNYSYSTKQTGDNYTFEFDNNPGKIDKRLMAAVHVLQSVYEDSSISPTYSETFMKESAQCFVFDANFFSYRACFLPNDYSPGNQDRFWGFVTQLPNAMWLITRNLLPAMLCIGLFFYLLRKK